MAGRTLAFGDVHGCQRELTTLLDKVAITSADTLVFVGDVVDRGPSSKQVIDELVTLRDTCQVIALMGNHEEMMRNAISGRGLFNAWLDVGDKPHSIPMVARLKTFRRITSAFCYRRNRFTKQTPRFSYTLASNRLSRCSIKHPSSFAGSTSAAASASHIRQTSHLRPHTNRRHSARLRRLGVYRYLCARG